MNNSEEKITKKIKIFKIIIKILKVITIINIILIAIDFKIYNYIYDYNRGIYGYEGPTVRRTYSPNNYSDYKYSFINKIIKKIK